VKLAKTVKPKFSAIREQFSKLNSVAQENIAGHRVIRAFTRESHETEKFAAENAEFKKRMMDSAYVWATYIPILETLSGAMMVIQLLVGGIFVIKDWLSMGDYFVFNSLIWGLTMPIRMMGWIVNDVERFHASAEKIMKLEDTESTITSPEHPVAKKTIEGKVEFRNVTFSYGDEAVLKNVSFCVEPGTKVGIIGPTGSGKTSLGRLMCRFYDCQEGAVLVDDVDVRRYNLQFLRSHVGVAMQDVFLHSDTIEGNIAFGMPDVPMSNVMQAAKLANVDSFVHELPDGYDTIIGERGVGLSGGQKQRVALARLLIKQPPIMIFDDTTSSVDVETERYIFESLKTYAHRNTMFIIAHRIISVMDADLILVLQDGQIIEQGTHQELLACKGYYHTVWQHQSSTGFYNTDDVADDYDEEPESLDTEEAA
jgi:ATP-binding cassette subfamily B protein